MNGLIFSVKKYSIHDGPGIRVTFFMKGCPLSCWWCHNPEGISPEPEHIVQKDKIGEKEFSRIEEVGKLYSTDDILEILESEKIFIAQSKGGVTFSGGEPMLQSEFLIEALKECKKSGYHTTVDTSGYSAANNFRSVIPYTDLFLFDIKQIDNEKHLKYTGVSNYLILENLHLLLDSGRDIMIRIPVVPGVNDDTGSMKNLKQFLIKNKTDNLKKINLLPYHKTGSSKYKKLNKASKMGNVEPPSVERMQELKEFFSDVGVKVKIGG